MIKRMLQKDCRKKSDVMKKLLLGVVSLDRDIGRAVAHHIHCLLNGDVLLQTCHGDDLSDSVRQTSRYPRITAASCEP